MPLRTKALFAILFAALLWSSAGTVGKVLMTQASPFVVATYRFGIASLILFPFFFKEKKPKGYLKHLLPLGIFNAANILFYYSGLALSTANAASILGTSVPIIIALLSPIIIHESVTQKKWGGIIIGLLGVLCIILLPIFQKGEAISGNIVGNLLLLGGNFSWSLYVISSRRALSKGNYSPLLATFVNILITTLAAVLATLITHQSLVVPALHSPGYVSVLLFAVIGITITTFFLFQWGVQHVSASTASLKEYVQLVCGVGLNIIILKEHFTIGYFIGGALVVTGVFIATSKSATEYIRTFQKNRQKKN